MFATFQQVYTQRQQQLVELKAKFQAWEHRQLQVIISRLFNSNNQARLDNRHTSPVRPILKKRNSKGREFYEHLKSLVFVNDKKPKKTVRFAA
jgi:hypothetical protein